MDGLLCISLSELLKLKILFFFFTSGEVSSHPGGADRGGAGGYRAEPWSAGEGGGRAGKEAPQLRGQ